MRPDALAECLRKTEILLGSRGDLTWERCSDWEAPNPPRHREPLNDEEQEELSREGVSQDEQDERRDDDAATKYRAEKDALAKRMAADAARMARIILICNPDPPKTLKNRDLLMAQVAAEGLCVSCYRDEQTIKMVELRAEKNPYVKAKPFYKDRCRWCGEWKAEHGQDPPLSILRKHHMPGSRVTTADVAKALGRPA